MKKITVILLVVIAMCFSSMAYGQPLSYKVDSVKLLTIRDYPGLESAFYLNTDMLILDYGPEICLYGRLINNSEDDVIFSKLTKDSYQEYWDIVVEIEDEKGVTRKVIAHWYRLFGDLRGKEVKLEDGVSLTVIPSKAYIKWFLSAFPYKQEMLDVRERMSGKSTFYSELVKKSFELEKRAKKIRIKKISVEESE